MELRFVTPDLRRLDLAVSEALVVPLFSDQRPPRGVAGLVDYRLAGHISELLRRETLRGAAFERLLVPGRPKLPFDKILLLGCGDSRALNPQVFAAAVDQVLNALAELGVRRAVVELPGRAQGLIGAELATEILLERAQPYEQFDTWTLVDTAEAAREVGTNLRRDRRR
ncbi:MAG TPA: M17 family peptidase N-terminal domain-containing protein, partial [Polyangiaceae bacterium]|nr:M17 family peptidase N-terminal domain-containing protein [Polyangiaceae bacterium]